MQNVCNYCNSQKQDFYSYLNLREMYMVMLEYFCTRNPWNVECLGGKWNSIVNTSNYLFQQSFGIFFVKNSISCQFQSIKFLNFVLCLESRRICRNQETQIWNLCVPVIHQTSQISFWSSIHWEKEGLVLNIFLGVYLRTKM